MRVRIITSCGIIAVAAVLIVILSALSPANDRVNEAYTPDNLVRLHIIANSDSAEDQALKLKVRDVILDMTRQVLKGVTSKEEAELILQENLPALQEAAQAYVRNHGKSYRVTAEIGRFRFPRRTYGDVVVPAGDYDALRIILGEGRGHNWWCVLFPPLCFVDVSRERLAFSRIEANGSPEEALSKLTLEFGRYASTGRNGFIVKDLKNLKELKILCDPAAELGRLLSPLMLFYYDYDAFDEEGRVAK
ncbi:MAG TPA: stage II sporulation protein R [Firmicutes bacterium]|nr:stage II sporulation protein R [Bacillota bacterium]